MATCSTDLSNLFVTSTKWFDVLIKIKQFRLAKEKTADQTKSGKHRIEVSDWSIIRQLWEKYHAAFGHVAIFFADENDGKAPFFRTDPLLYHKFDNMVLFRPGTLYSLYSPGNQDYQKTNFMKKVEIGDQSSIIKNI